MMKKALLALAIALLFCLSVTGALGDQPPATSTPTSTPKPVTTATATPLSRSRFAVNFGQPADLWPSLLPALGVIIGALLTHAFSMAREKKQWDREQESQSREHLREAYQNSIDALSTYIALNEDPDKAAELKHKVSKWISQVLIYHREDLAEKNSILRKWFDDFLIYSELAYANYLRDYIIELAKSDTRLSSNIKPISSAFSDEIDIAFRIDADFCRQQFINGKPVPQHLLVRYKLHDLTPSQRSKLWDILQSQPDHLQGLPLPAYHRRIDEIVKTSAIWPVRLDPRDTSPKKLFAAWEADYDRALEQAQQEQQAAFEVKVE
jgi:hypothetical protein